MEDRIPGHPVVIGADFDGHCALARRGDEFFRLQEFGDDVFETHADQASGGKDRAVALIAGGLAQAGVHVAADRDDLQVGTFFGDLSGAPGAAGADADARGKLVQRGTQVRNKDVPGIGPLEDGSDDHAVGERGGHVLEAVDGHVDFAGFQATLDFLDEHAETHSGQWGVAVGIALGRNGDDLEADVGMGPVQGGEREVGLDQGQPTAAGANPNDVPGLITDGHGACPPGDPRRTF